MILTIPPSVLVEVNEVDFDVCCIGPGVDLDVVTIVFPTDVVGVLSECGMAMGMIGLTRDAVGSGVGVDVGFGPIIHGVAGSFVGFFVGFAVGDLVGAGLGEIDGAEVDNVGDTEGDALGVEDGEDVTVVGSAVGA